ncbi:MAG TPA: IS200/IS605 family transposase [Pyrinomonadaceae bacterium]|nr:IS200/IS605 family transposase [Pyrinomonadaceae bacterium]
MNRIASATPEFLPWQIRIQLFYHLVFSTKNRENFISQAIEDRVWAYIGGVARKHKMTAIQVGGIENHIHALILAKPIVAPFQIAQWIKGDSSNWIHKEFPDIRGFSWQDGYSIFSVSRSSVPNVAEYIRNQREHHLGQAFEDEYIELLKKHGTDYDEQFVFG